MATTTTTPCTDGDEGGQPSLSCPSSSSQSPPPSSSSSPFSCAQCHQSSSSATRLLECAGCRSVSYCSKSCQVQHWRHGGHKKECKDMARHAFEKWFLEATSVHAPRENANIPLLRKALEVGWQLRSDRVLGRTYVWSLARVARYEHRNGTDASKGKVLKQLAQVMREKEWPKEVESLKSYVSCLESMNDMGHAEEVYVILRDRGAWLEQMMKDDDNSRWILLYSWLRSCFTFMEKGDNKHDEVLGSNAMALATKLVEITRKPGRRRLALHALYLRDLADHACWDLGLNEVAVVLARRSMEMCHDDGKWHTISSLLVQSLLNLGRAVEAYHVLIRNLQRRCLQPFDSMCDHNMLMEILLNLGRPREAAHHLAQCEKIFQEHPEILEDRDSPDYSHVVSTCRSMADIYDALGDVEQARKWDELMEGYDGFFGATVRLVERGLLMMARGEVDRQAVKLGEYEEMLLDIVGTDSARAVPGWLRVRALGHTRRATALLSEVYEMMGSHSKAQEARHKEEELKEEEDKLFQMAVEETRRSLMEEREEEGSKNEGTTGGGGKAGGGAGRGKTRKKKKKGKGKRDGGSEEKQREENDEEQEEEEECPMCLELLEVGAIESLSLCHHRYHTSCLDRLVEHCVSKGVEGRCPMCRAPIIRSSSLPSSSSS